MPVINLDHQLDQIADALNNDEVYRPVQFAAMLATVSDPEPEIDVETEDESIE